MTTERAATPSRPAKPRRVSFGSIATVIIGGLVLWSTWAIDIPPDRLATAPNALLHLLRQFVPPDADYGQTKVLPAILDSLAIAWIGTLIGALLSFPLGFLAAGNLFPRLKAPLKVVLAGIRAFPELVLAIYFVPVVGLGPFAGALAVGIHSIGMLGKLTADIVESTDLRPVEAVRASGGNGLEVLRFAVLPQVLSEIVALWLFRFEINLRASAVLGVVGAGGIGALMSDTLKYRQYEKTGAVILATVILVLIVDALSGAIRQRLTRE